jgi:ribosomal protein L22
VTGRLADTSVFGPSEDIDAEETDPDQGVFDGRSIANVERALNPRPNARARWQARMVAKHVRRGGRLTKEMLIARTERQHQLQSHFFKTSQKKLRPLATQIAGKSIDEAILQMRFSKKKVAQDIHAHLIHARNEAMAVKGMGMQTRTDVKPTLPTGAVVLDPSITPPEDHQLPSKVLRKGEKVSPTDIYIAQAWINRGKYGRVPEYRAKGSMNILRPPYTGLTVLLKEEKTRTRERTEKEVKAIRKRIGKNLWTQLPDRPVTRQSQHVLW